MNRNRWSKWGAHAQSFSEVLFRERMGLTFEKRLKIQSNTLVRPIEPFISTYIFTKYFKILHQATLNKCIVKNRLGILNFFIMEQGCYYGLSPSMPQPC